MDKLLNAQETAEILNCHLQSVYRNKELPRTHIPGVGLRFKQKEIEKYLENRTIIPFSLFSSDFPQNNEIIRDNRLLFIPETPILYSGGSEMPKGNSKTRTNKKFKGVYTRKTKRGEIRFYIYYYDPNGKRVRMCIQGAQTFEEAALAREREIQRSFDIAYGVKRKKTKIKFQDFAEMYIEDYAKPNKKSWESDWYYLKGMKSYFKDFYLIEMTSQNIEKYKKMRLTEGVEKSTINRCMAILSKMFNLAREWGYLPEEWKMHFNFYSEKGNARIRTLSREEEQKLLDASCEHLRSMIIIALNTGMRRGEILNLQWDQIDFKTKKIQVDKTKSGNPKTVPINSSLLSELVRLKNMKNQSEYVFLNPETKKPFTTIKTAFRAACRRADIQDFKFHDLRGTVATRLDEIGISPKVISKILGHSSVRITSRHYIRPGEDQEFDAVEQLTESSAKNGKNEENVSPICHRDQDKKGIMVPSSLFSIN